MADILINVNELFLSRKFIVGAAVAAMVAVLFLVPLLPVNARVDQMVTQTQSQPYQMTENHTVTYEIQQPIRVTKMEFQTRQQVFGNYSEPVLKPYAIRYWSGYAQRGATVDYAFSLGGPANFYIVPAGTFSQYPPIDIVQKGSLLTRENVYYERGTFVPGESGLYYFILYNPSTSGVNVIYASSGATWQEQAPYTQQVFTNVTQSKQVYGTVTKYRDVPVQVSQTVEISKRGTLLDIVRSKDPVGALLNSFQILFGDLISAVQNIGKSRPAPAPSPAGSQSSQDKLQAYNKLLQNFSDSGAGQSPRASSSNPASSAANSAASISKSVQQLARNPGVAGVDTCAC